MAEPGRVAPELRLCRGCRQYVWDGPQACDFCGADIDALEAEHEAAQAAVWEAAEALRAALAEAQNLASQRFGDSPADGRNSRIRPG